MRTISIIGATYYGNRGAEAMLSTVVGYLGKKYGNEIRFNVFSYYPVEDRQLVHDDRISIYSATPAYLVLIMIPLSIIYAIFRSFRLGFLVNAFPDSIVRMAESKVLVCIAGVSFIDSRSKVLPYNVATLLPAMILRTPIIKLSQALGPFKKKPNKWFAKFVLKRCEAVFTRGDKTLEYMTDLFGKDKIIYSADDLVFLFSSDYVCSRAESSFHYQFRPLQEAKLSGAKIIGICPSSVVAARATRAGWDYVASTAAVIQALVDKGFTIALYPNATRAYHLEKSHNNDLPLIAKISEAVSQVKVGTIIKFDGNLNAAQIQSIISACDINMVSRFHAMIISLVACVPPLVIGWSHKYAEVMEKFGQLDMVFDCSIRDIGIIASGVQRLYAEREERGLRIGSALPGVMRSSESQLSYLANVIER